jgi:hypothetical protein
VSRDEILKLLSDAELARVSTADAGAPLKAGDEYLDLEHLDRGVQSASTNTVTARSLPRKVIQEATWKRILARLSPPASAPSHAGA